MPSASRSDRDSARDPVKEATVQIRDTASRVSRSMLAVPLLTLCVIFVLGLCKVSGSSIGLHSETDPSPQTALSARPIRTDEWLTRTPLVIRQATLNFPASTELGVGTHDTGVLSDLPVKSISVVVKPHSLVYFVFDVERAFAMEWWLVALGPFLGVYAILAVLTKSRWISALSGLLVTLAPAAVWWAIPTTGLSVMYGGFMLALFLAACRASGRRRYLLGAAAGWSAACFAVMLYLPWLLPLSLLFGAIALTQLRGVFRGWRQIAAFAAAMGGVFAVLMAVFFREHHVALQAINNSIYPGHRISPSGEARPSLLFGAPFDVLAASRNFVNHDGTNQSEAASGLMLWLPILIVGGGFSGLRSRVAAHRALAAVLAVSAILAAWALLPIPERLGTLLGLTSVPGSRLFLPLTVAGALAAGLYVHRIVQDPSQRPSADRVAIAALTFAFITGWVGTQTTIDDAPTSRAKILILLVLITAATAAILNGKVMLGLGSACVFLMFGSLRVNPIQIGLTPVTKDPLMLQIERARIGHESARWAALGLAGHPRSILAASGAPSVTHVSWYADQVEWAKLDPAGTERTTWDRFAMVSMDINDGVDTVQFNLPAADQIVITTPACAGALQSLGVSFVISDHELNSPCLHAEQSPDATGERFIYSVS